MYDRPIMTKSKTKKYHNKLGTSERHSGKLFTLLSCMLQSGTWLAVPVEE